MNLKQSCFKSVYKSDIKRFWWISALFTLGMILIIGVPFFYYVDNYIIDVRNGFEWVDRQIESGMNTYLYMNYVFAVAIGAFLSMGLFSYNSHVASVTFYHSIPIKRHKLMAAHTLSAVTLAAVPIFLNTILCAFAVRGVFSIKPVLISMCLYFVYALLSYVIFTFIGMLTGNVPSQAIFSVVFALIPFFSVFTMSYMCENYFFGYYSNERLVDFLLEWIYLSPSELMTAKVFVYLFFIVAFYALAVLAYTKRNLENYGEVIAFPQFKGLFKVLFGICAGILGYFYCVEFWNLRTFLVMILFGSLGVIIANMLANKSFSLRGTKAALICNVAFVAVMICVFRFDITGFEKRIPDVNDVEYVEILNYTDDGELWGGAVDGDEHGPFLRTDYYRPQFSDKESVMKFIEFHKAAIENKNNFTHSMLSNEISDIPYNVYIKYTLKNGKTISRQYPFGDDKVSVEFIEYIFESPEFLKFQYPVLDGTEKTYTAALCNLSYCDVDEGAYDEEIIEEEITEYDEGDEDVIYDASAATETHENGNWVEIENNDIVSTHLTKSEDIKKLVEAITKDRENMSFEEYTMRRINRNSFVSIDLDYTVPAISEKSGKKYNIFQTDEYRITPFDTNTIAFLSEKGICDFDDLMQNDNIETIVVNEWNIKKLSTLYDDYDEYYDYYSDGNDIDKSGYSGKSAVFSTEEEIALFLEYYNETYESPANILNENAVKINFEVKYKNNTISDYTIIDDFDDLPLKLKEIAKLL